MNSEYNRRSDKPTRASGGETGDEGEDSRGGYSGGYQRSDLIGPYKLLQQIGEGGMGTVWMAEQEVPVRRRVALKLVRADVGSRDTIARFEAERQAVAMMDHQNIARFYDVGTTESGAPYFAMELVKGIPITKYCDKNKLSVRERLELMIPVCHAVQHAHQKGILHRDIKPSNILVTLYDGKAVAKVIDFGLAKALDSQHKLTEKTLFTEYGKVVGTLQYMSPEQAEMNALDVDTRTDIYSLGVILYELLSGSTPVQKETVNSNVIFKVLEIIREKDPPAPSIRLGEIARSAVTKASSGDKKQTKLNSSKIVERRKTSEAGLEKLLKGELDWIVMKSLEKDRTRRYETANELASDIRRFLDDEPILARPQSKAYKIKRFVRRNKGWVAAAATIAALLVAGVAGTTNYAIKAESARRDAVKLREQADAEARDAILARNLADKNAELAQKSTQAAKKSKMEALDSAKRAEDILKIVTDSFASANPFNGAEADVLARDVLINTRKILDESDLDDEGKRTLHRRLTNLFITLSEHEAAVASANSGLELTKKIDPNHPELHLAMMQVAHAESQAGKYEKGIQLYKDTLKHISDNLGKDHVDKLDALHGIGLVLSKAGKNHDAIPYLEQALAGREDEYGLKDARTITSMGTLGMALSKSGDSANGLKRLNEAWELAKTHLKIDHPYTLGIQSSVASAYHRTQQLDLAKSVYLDLLKLRSKKLSENHPTNLGTRSNIALIELTQGNFVDAVSKFDVLVGLQIEGQGEDHPETIATRMNRTMALNHTKTYASEYMAKGQFKEAEELLAVLTKYSELLLDPVKIQVARDQVNSQLAQKKFKDAQGSLKLWIELLNATKDEGEPSDQWKQDFGAAMTADAACWVGLEDYPQADDAVKKVLKLEGIRPIDALRCDGFAAECLAHENDKEKVKEAVRLSIESFKGLEEKLQDLHSSQKWLVSRSCERVLGSQRLADNPDGVEQWQAKLDSLNNSLDEVYKSVLPFSEAQKTNQEIWDMVKNTPTENSVKLSDEQLETMRGICKSFPTGMFANTLALAEFRSGNYREAIAASEVSLVKLTKELHLPAPLPNDYGVIAASHLMLGEIEKANEFRELMDEGFKHKRFKNDVECVRIVREFTNLFESKQPVATE